MKQISCHLLLLIILSACASTPKNPNACKVWSDETSTPDSVYVEDEAAFYGAGCITGRVGCQWKEARFEGDDIVVHGELSKTNGPILTYKKGELALAAPTGIVEKTIRGAISDGVNFQFLPDRVIIKTKLIGMSKMISGGKDEHVVNVMHSKCTQREAALGVGFLLAGRKNSF